MIMTAYTSAIPAKPGPDYLSHPRAGLRSGYPRRYPAHSSAVEVIVT